MKKNQKLSEVAIGGGVSKLQTQSEVLCFFLNLSLRERCKKVLTFLYHLIGLVMGFPKRHNIWRLNNFSGVWDKFWAFFLAILFYFLAFLQIVLLILLYNLICLVKDFPKRYHIWILSKFSGFWDNF